MTGLSPVGWFESSPSFPFGLTPSTANAKGRCFRKEIVLFQQSCKCMSHSDLPVRKVIASLAQEVEQGLFECHNRIQPGHRLVLRL